MADIHYEPLIISHEPDGLALLSRRLALWLRRLRDRAELAQFDERSLQDIGLTRAEAEYEASKPFWRD